MRTMIRLPADSEAAARAGQKLDRAPSTASLPRPDQEPAEPTSSGGTRDFVRRLTRWYASRSVRVQLFLAFAALDAFFLVLVLLLFPIREWQEMRSGRENPPGEVVQIAVFADGERIAGGGSGEGLIPDELKTVSGPEAHAADGSLFIAQPVEMDGGRATVVVELSRNPLRGELAEGVVLAGLLSIVFLLIGAVLAWLLERGITRPIREMVDAVTGVTASGSWDLTRRVSERNTNDELGRLAVWVNRFLSGSTDLVSSVQKVSSGVISGANEISFTLEELSASAEALSDSIAHVAENAQLQAERMQQNLVMTSQTAELAEKVRESAVSAGAASVGVVESARAGRGVAQQAQLQMSHISERTAVTKQVMGTLHSLSGRIDQIVVAIQQIAERTNLLALNAAIEAARAGEHGQGFAVVADEVRKLADQANQHAGEIGESVEAIRGEVSKAVAAVGNVESEVENGAAVIASTAELLGTVVTDVESVARDIETITRLAAEQQDSLEHVAENASELAELSESQAASAVQMSATVEEQTASTNSVASSAEVLTRLVRELQNEMKRIET